MQYLSANVGFVCMCVFLQYLFFQVTKSNMKIYEAKEMPSLCLGENFTESKKVVQ